MAQTKQQNKRDTKVVEEVQGSRSLLARVGSVVAAVMMRTFLVAGGELNCLLKRASGLNAAPTLSQTP